MLLLLFLMGLLAGCGSSGRGEERTPPVPAAKSITVFPSTASIQVGQTLQYSAVVKDTNGNIVKSGTVTWQVDNGAVAQINTDGLLTAMAAGSTAVTAMRGSLASQLAALTVTAVPVLDATGLPHAGSYAQAKAALGLQWWS